MNWRVLRLTYWTNTKGLIPGPLDKTFYTIHYYIQYNNTGGGGAMPQTPPPQFQSTLVPIFFNAYYISMQCFIIELQYKHYINLMTLNYTL